MFLHSVKWEISINKNAMILLRKDYADHSMKSFSSISFILNIQYRLTKDSNVSEFVLNCGRRAFMQNSLVCNWIHSAWMSFPRVECKNVSLWNRTAIEKNNQSRNGNVSSISSISYLAFNFVQLSCSSQRKLRFQYEIGWITNKY